MRHRCLLLLSFLLAASPLTAQQRPPVPDSAAVRPDSVAPPDSAEVQEKASDIRLRLGLKPVEGPFAVDLPGPPGIDLLWLRPRFTDWVGEWTRATERNLATRRDAIWQRQRLRTSPLAAGDTVTYLPLPPARPQARGGELIPGVVGEYADIGMIISGRGELGGSWTRFEPCNPSIQFNCNPSLFPQLKPDVQFGVQVGGTVSDRVHVNVDYDQRREFDAANNINVYYQGMEDEILQRLEVGDVSIQLPSSRYVTQGIPAGNFGFKAMGQLGPLDFQAVWAQQKGDVSTREFRLGGGGGGQAGLVQDAEIVLDDADYAKGQFFFLVDPDSIVESPHVDILGLRVGDAPASGRPAPGTVRVYRDERPSFLNPQQIAQLGYFPAVAESAPMDADTLRHQGTFRLLTLGEDYLVHASGLWIMLRQPLRADEALGVTFVTETGEQVGTPNAEQAPSGTTPVLRMLRGPASIHQPGQPTWRFEMHQVYRLDSSNGVEAASVDLKISRGELAGGGTFVDFGGQQLSFLKLFGLDEDSPADQVDAAQIYQPGRDAFGGTQQDSRIGGTYIVFPTLRPFAEPPPVPSVGLGAEQARAVLASDSNAVIYENPDPVIRESSSRFRLNFKYRVRIEGLVSTFNLGAFGIREESERIFVDGQLLQRNVDYDIDYDIGMVSLRDAQSVFGANPDADIRATWEQKAVFQLAPTSVFGMNTRYQLGRRGELNFMGLYQSEKSLMSRPQLGLEPGAIFLGGASGRLDFGATWLDRALEKVPGLRLGGMSAANLTGELAMSLPNPNTRGDTYLDDFEGSDEIHIGLERNMWRLGSMPQDPTGALDLLPLPLEVFNAGRLTWQDFFLTDEGHIVGPTTPDGIDRQINVVGTGVREQVLYLTFGDTAVGPGEVRWRSLTTVLSTTGRDMTRSEFLEFYVAHDPSREMALIFDFGTVSEDAFYFDAEGRVSGTYPDGREWGQGILDEEARLSEREIWSVDSDQRGLWNQECMGALDNAFALGDSRANCTRGNGRVDTEDLDGNGILDAVDGPIHRFVVRLDGTSPYLVRDTTGTGTVFSLYRIPLRGTDAIGLPGASAGSWRFVKHLRMTLVGQPNGGTVLALARPRIVGSRWTKRGATGIIAGLTSDDPGLGQNTSRLEVGPVSRLTDGAAYASPPGVRDQLQDPTSAFGVGSTEFNEKSLRLRYEDLEPAERGEVYFRYPQQPRNFMSYRQIRMWAVPRAGNWGPQGGERLLVKVGTDARNYYLYQAPLRPAVDGSAVQPSDWLPEIVIDFERWFELRTQAEEELIINPRQDGEPLVVWSADSAYAVVLEDRGRAPNLSAVREISFAVYNAAEVPAYGGEVWINDMRLSGAVTDPGFAGHLTLDIRGGDFMTTSIGYSNQGAYFRQLNQDASYQTRGDLNVATSLQLGNLLPSSLGIDLPVVVNHSRGGMQPTFLERSDVRADHLQGLRETSHDNTRIGVSLRKRTPSANPWMSLLLDGAQLQFGYNTASTSSVVASSEASGVNARATYGRQPEARQFDAVPGAVESVLRGLVPEALERSEFFQRLTGARLRWSPESITFSSGYFGQRSEQFRYDRILETEADTAIAPFISERQGLENEARIAFRPFQTLTADVSLLSSRDLLPAAKATTREHEREAIENARARLGGTDIGWETGRSLNSSIAFRPDVTRWLRPGFTYSTQFRTDRNPSYIGFIHQGGDSVAVMQRRFQATRQVTQSLLLEPAGLAQALLGPRRTDEGAFRRAAFRVTGVVQPLDLSWSTGVGSQFEREAFMPGLGYQLGRGDLESFRIIDGDTAVSANERHQFRARSGVRLPLGVQADLGYASADGTAYDLRGGDLRQDDRTWPDLRVSWQSVPLPDRMRRYVAHLSVTSGFQARQVESERFGEFIEQRRSSRDRTIPLQVSLSTLGGVTASYSANRTRGEVEDGTGNAESSATTHSVQVSASIMPPEHMRERLAQPVVFSLRYTYNGQHQCRARGGADDDAPAECVPFVDVVNRGLNFSLDTVISDLNVGLQMSYTDRQSFVGTRSGQSQFQLGLFGQFHFSAGSMGPRR